MNSTDNQFLTGLKAAQAAYMTTLIGWANVAKRMMGGTARKIEVK